MAVDQRRRWCKTSVILIALVVISGALAWAGWYLDRRIASGIGGVGLLISLFWHTFRTNNTEPHIEYGLSDHEFDLTGFDDD